MNYQTVILTGLNILKKPIKDVKTYLEENSSFTNLKVLNFDFKHLNYFLSDLIFNRKRIDELDQFKATTLIVWLDKSKSFKDYSNEQLYHTDLNNAKTSLKLISDFDNIFFDYSKDNLYTDIIPNIMEVLTCEQQNLHTLLFELS